MVVYYPIFFPKNGNKEQTILRAKRINGLLDEIIDPDKDNGKFLFETEREILEQDKPNVWNVWKENNMERVLEVDFQKFAISVTENAGQDLATLTTFTFYATVEYLKEKFKK